MGNLKKSAAAILASSISIFFATTFFACSSDSTPSAPETPNYSSVAAPLPSSSSVTINDNPPLDSIAPIDSVEQVLSSSSTGSTITLTATPDIDGFYDIADIYKAAPAESKIVFVIRHAEREASLGQESMLTELGVASAQALGARIGEGEKFYYASTDFIRTRETAANIAKGRNETAEVVTWDGINGSYFYKVSSDSADAVMTKRGGSWKNLSQWFYGVTISNAYVAKVAPDLFYELYSRGDQFINDVILANLANWNRVSILVTHDVLIEPLVIYASNRMVDVKFFDSGRWVNYMTGIAVIVNGDSVTLLPVRGMDVGYMTVKKDS